MKKIIFVALFISLYLVFRACITEVLISTFLYDWFSKVDSNRVTSAIFIFWTITILVFYYQRFFKDVRSNETSLFVIFLIVVTYVIERNIYDTWIYYPRTWPIKYSDLIYVIAIAELSLIVKVSWGLFNKGESQTANESLFISDRPLENPKEDEFHRAGFAKKIAVEINNSYFDKSYSIAIISEWAGGKSTFLNFIAKEIDPSERIIIKFKPWLNFNSGAILKSFFEQLKVTLGKYDKNFSRSFDRYYQSIVNLDNSLLTKISTSIPQFLEKDKTIEEEYDEINIGLQNINKQLVIIIDDLDRLDHKEIIEVFKLIRNTADFRNTIFITALDRPYVTNAIKQLNDYNPHLYIDKVFDFEYSLPEIGTEYILEGINEFLEEKHPPFQVTPDSAVAKVVKDFIKSKRDLNRFKTHLNFNYNEINKELVASDLLILEVIRFRYPQILSFFYANHEFYLGIQSIRVIGQPISLAYPKDEKLSCLEIDLRENERNPNTKFHLSISDIEKIVSAFKILLENNDQGLFNLGKETGEPEFNSIRIFPYFHAYFKLVFGADTLKITELLSSINEDWETYKKTIDNHLTGQLGTKPIQIFSILREKFDFLIETENKHHNSIKLLLFIECIGAPIPNDLFAQFLDRETTQIRQYFPSVEDIKQYFLRLFNDNGFSHHGRSRLIYSFLKKYLDGIDYRFFMSLDDLKELNASIFSDYLGRIDKVSNTLMDLYYNNWDSVDANTRMVTLYPKVSAKLREFISNNHETGYLNLLIRPAMFPNYENRFVFEPFAPQIFSNWDTFKAFLLDVTDEYPHKEVLVNYFERFEENGYKNFHLDDEEIGKAPNDFVNMFPEN